MHADAAAVERFIIGDTGAGGLDPGGLQRCVQRLDDGADRRPLKALGRELSEPERGQGLDGDFAFRHDARSFNDAESRLDRCKPGRVGGKLVSQPAAGRTQQSDGVVVVQPAHRHPAGPGEISYLKHDIFRFTASHRVRVQPRLPKLRRPAIC